MTKTLQSIAKMIDHSLLHPMLTDQELIDGCLVAIKHQVASICIKPYAVPLAKEILAGSEVKVGTVIGFPHGSSKTAIKLKEARMALAIGAAQTGIFTDTGEGGLVPEEAWLVKGYENQERTLKRWEPGGYLVVQWSTGRWGVSADYVRAGDAVEIKIGQGAKPGMGGHLLGAKVTAYGPASVRWERVRLWVARYAWASPCCLSRVTTATAAEPAVAFA